MTNQNNYALYYPSIEFADPQWLWASALIWDRIYRIVPEGYEPEDSDNVKRLCETEEIGIAIRPERYSKMVSENFIKKLRTRYWNAAALSDDVDEEYSRLHSGKVDVELRKMIIAKGAGSAKGEWLHVPTDFQASYMMYLAEHISRKADLSLVTDSTAAWTGTTYFSYDGHVADTPSEELSHMLAAMFIRDFIPSNLINIGPEKLLAFRKKRGDERRRFVNAVKVSANKLSNCRDAEVARDIYEDLKKDISSSLDDYRKSMDVLKVEGWTGIKTIVFPAVTNVISKYYALNPEQIFILSATGLALGAISGIASMKIKRKKLAKEYNYSYLLNVNREWKKCYQGNDLSYLLSRQMEEFIND